MSLLLRAWWLLAQLLLALHLLPAVAHEISMAELELRQTAPNEFVWQWSSGNRSGDAPLQLRWPPACNDEAGLLRCGAQGFSGSFGIDGLDGVGQRLSALLVRVHWLDGQMRVYTLTKAQPSVQVFGSADDRRALGEVASAYLLLGVEHILGGIDHLLFVLALAFLVGFGPRLWWTVTAFTVAHSLTLVSSALGLLVLRVPPVEAAIALSIVLVAGEALGREQTLTRRFPALVAFLFGLVHGLAFAGALQAYGLPENHRLAALVTFNLGVEIGQLVVLQVAWALAWGLGRIGVAARARVPALYAIGALAVYWTFGRFATLVA